MRALALLATVVLLAGCASTPAPTAAPTTAAPEPSPTPTATVDPLTLGPVIPTGRSATVTGGLDVPWSVVRLPNGTALISERDTAVIVELGPDLSTRVVGTVDGVVPGGEGGLLGLEYDAEGEGLFVYFTAANDNRIVRYDLTGGPGSYGLGGVRVVLTGIAKANTHNGGRIKIGPDGMLYATVGDAGVPALAQSNGSFNGKILRMELDGSIPADNPSPISHIYSSGHRNPQGIAWDADGQLWAAEFGQNTWDEFNRIEAGGNYGWPIVEGIGSDPAYVNPVLQWPTSDASPSGLAYVRGTFFLAALRGQRLWVIQTAGETVTAEPWFVGEFGRIRDVTAGPDGSVWLVTNNTDGRGTPGSTDDRVVQFVVAPVG
jgi:glucose/arabinose dehydrogenase